MNRPIAPECTFTSCIRRTHDPSGRCYDHRVKGWPGAAAHTAVPPTPPHPDTPAPRPRGFFRRGSK